MRLSWLPATGQRKEGFDIGGKKKRPGRGYIVIDGERCKGCCYCISVCPEEVIRSASYVNQIGCTPAAVIEERNQACSGCTVCAIICPDAAILVYHRDKTSGVPDC